MIKTILWDFDGVILDSMKIKANGFLELFKEYDENYLKELEKYHYENGGISRFDKIRYFHNEIIKTNITEDEVIKLADKFAKIIESKLFNQENLIEETVVFIKENFKKYNFHIVSGAEHQELNKLCRNFKLTQYFKSIDGSPTKKEILVKNILEEYHYKKEETILIGDAMTDYQASVRNGIEFYGYNNIKLQKFNYINSMQLFM